MKAQRSLKKLFNYSITSLLCILVGLAMILLIPVIYIVSNLFEEALTVEDHKDHYLMSCREARSNIEMKYS